ncbi:MAG: MATE family efflux transporter [Oscillospiraceae bacterium]|nr:MATE family efflux transporter [Oscillospiraceae bacterium]
MYRDLTKGNITKGLVLFALPMIAGNLLQQLYNIADTLIVGRALGRNALAAVGSAYTLMTFLTSVFLGLSMGAGALFSICLGKQDKPSLRSAVAHALGLILGVTLLLNAAVYLFLDEILLFLQIPAELAADMRTYLLIIFAGLLATSVYNFFACLLRAVGNSVAPLWFLGISALLNIGLDLLFVLVFHWGIAGAAAATVFSQYVSGVGLLAYTFLRCREFLPSRAELRFRREILRELLDLSMLTCAQQSAMNFGILLIQRLVDSFGPITMAAFAAAVKIDTFAYLPVQDFGNAFSTFVAQNFGAGRTERLRRGFRQALLLSAGFSVVLSALVCIFAHPLMHIFVQAGETEVLAAGVRYLRVEGAFYAGIGCLFLLYGFYRAVKRPGMSVVLTVISLGTRVALAYALAGTLGEVGIWAAIPIGWVLADLTGLGYYLLRRTKLLGGMEKTEI